MFLDVDTATAVRDSPVGLDFEEFSQNEVAAEHKVSLALRDVL
jgi:hypothetical protein